MSLAEMFNKYGDPVIHSTKHNMIRALFHDKERDEVYIFVHDSGGSFVLNPPKHLAMDAYKTPHFYAEANMRGIENPRKLNPTLIDRVVARIAA